MRSVILSVLSFFPLTTFAAEPWADKKLPPAGGLELWLDASAQAAALGARKTPLAASGEVDIWLDGSGNRRDLRQPLVDFRPKLITGAGGAFVQFDGTNDFVATAPGVEMPEATVFVVAAPRANAGFFPGFFGMNRTGQNDYTSGLNFDLGGKASPTLSTLNAEATGAGGERNLLKTQFDFGTFHVFSLAVGADSIKLRADGKDEGSRPRKPAAISMEELTVGARRYSHDGHPPFAGSFLDGGIAELIIFRGVLPDAERDAVEKYLIAKHSGLRTAATATVPGGPRILTPVANPPPVQMFVPGFEVRELPLKMTNIDCLRYRHDGVLVAGAYNGKIWLLRDTDGDGSEDKVELYWESGDLKNVIGMALTPKGDPRGDGVFVATAGRILFIPDKNHDNRGDEQIIVASGWEKQKTPGGGGSVDALGLALAPDGSIYFGLGVSAYNNAYLLDADGKSHFDIKTERGTVQRIFADFSKRETICTGIRYPVGAQFNKHGDLFMTEQEGATWLPNGNPFDELVHIEKGRHYGFPPRHPKHLPDVIDEPSVFDYGPQHQSTCGFVFNEGDKTFGPDWWKGDAFVTGESRGKLYRTKLVKTGAGYVAQNQLIAALAMLPVDVTLSPRGDLIVACHSGAPDWGSGPEGAGKLFRISAAKEPVPRPVLTYFASASELRVTFDHDLEPTKLRDLAKRTEIVAGRYVAAGDRYESFRPGYQVVRDQMAAPRRDVPVLGATLSADKRSINFAIPPQSVAEQYAITMPDFTKPPGTPHAFIDLATDMSGVAAEWTSADGKTKWKGWLPHLDFEVARQLAAGSAEHAQMTARGEVRTNWQFAVSEMLQPAVQPGAKLDYERSPENVTVTFTGETGFALAQFPQEAKPSVNASGDVTTMLTSNAHDGFRGPFELWSRVSGKFAGVSVTWHTADDERQRAFPVRRFLLPFAKPADAKAAEPVVAKLEGDWLNGRRLYFGKAQCATCHTTGGQGGRVGPDLSNLSFRDRASVEKDIREPGAALNPDHLTYHITLKNGAELAAVMLTEDKEKYRIGEANGTVRDLPRADVRGVKALPISLMPPGLLDALTPAEQNDVIKFLLTPAPLVSAPIDAPNPPAARKRAELEAVLRESKQSTVGSGQSSPLRVLLVSAKKDHGPGEHDYPLFQKRWSTLLGLANGVEVTTAQDWPTVEQLAKADVAVFYSNNPAWNPERKAELDAFLQRGGGAVFIHWAIEGREFAPELADCIGLASNSKALKFRHGALTMNFPNAEHPITRGFKATDFIDETYWQAIGDPKRIMLLGDVVEEGEPRPQLWAREHGKGRVFVSIPGHYTWTFDDPLHRLLLLRGICWVSRQGNIDRLSELATIGARMEW
ncbi:MAG: hypothetical protein RL088_2716 [Verrucomicrobiota bacterium]|jgi:putative heme-binding domain-containing protein